MAQGKIPTRIAIYLRHEVPYEGARGPRLCRPAFVTDAESSRTRETAEKWARGLGYYGGPGATRNDPPEVVEVDNVEIPTLEIVGLDHRAEGGRAYKVVTPEGYLVDLREDVFLEVLFRAGIPKTLKVTGPFLWVQNGSQMRLVRVGSDLHNLIRAADEIRQQPKRGKIPVRDLMPGGVYATADERHAGAIYLGRVRLNGKLKTAWIPLSLASRYGNDWQRRYDEHCQNRSDIEVRNGCSFTKLVGQVILSNPPIRPVWIVDGYGNRLKGQLTDPLEYV